MQCFEFAIRVSVFSSRHTAKKLQEKFQEALENVTMEEWALLDRVIGMTVEVSTVKAGE